MGGFVLIAIAVVGFVAGVRAFGCETVSFSRDLMTCHQSSAGPFPGVSAGAGLMVISLLFALAGVTLFFRR